RLARPAPATTSGAKMAPARPSLSWPMTRHAWSTVAASRAAARSEAPAPNARPPHPTRLLREPLLPINRGLRPLLPRPEGCNRERPEEALDETPTPCWLALLRCSCTLRVWHWRGCRRFTGQQLARSHLRRAHQHRLQLLLGLPR